MCLLCVKDGNTTRHTNPRWDGRERYVLPEIAHGTYHGYRQHTGRHETPCGPCLQARDEQRKAVKAVPLAIGIEVRDDIVTLSREVGVSPREIVRLAVETYRLLRP